MDGPILSAGDVVSVMMSAGTALVQGRVVAIPAPPAIIPFTFSNGWRVFGGGAAPYGHAGFWRDASGRVHLEGLLDRNGANWAVQVILTLPVGYRPPSARVFHPGVNPANAAARVDVQPNGQLLLQVGGASNPVGYLTLSGISFLAA
ncbi:MAG: hypothetical protein Q8O56_06155 [Solirubrobacteraceae bacterium]|nr:hypothetical protein [Solirubrobacteraceae bacterium]